MQVNACISWLKALDIAVPSDWVEACLQWVQQEHGNITNPKDLNRKVYQQWLVANLADFETPTLPDEINDAKYVLKGKICLQIINLKDIAQPLYGQLLDIQKRNNPNNYVTAETQHSTQNVKQNRMLSMTLTDGVTKIKAMECKPIDKLNLQTPPGTKVRIIGPVTCRRGVIMLKPSNLEVLGGEVEELFEQHNFKSVIHRHFGLIPAQVEHENNTNGSISNLNIESNQQINEEIPNDILDELMDDDDDFLESDTRPLKHVEKITNTIAKTIKNNIDSINTNNYLPNTNVDNKSLKRKAETSNIPKAQEMHQNKRQSLELPNMDSYIDCMMDDFDDDFELESVSKVTENEPIVIDDDSSDLNLSQQQKLSYLCEVLPNNKTKLKACNVCIKAVIITLCSKLKHDPEIGWSIVAKICDGTKTINARFSDNVLTKLLGPDINIKTEDPVKQKEIQQRMRNCKDVLIDMYQYMDIEITVQNLTPQCTVIGIRENL